MELLENNININENLENDLNIEKMQNNFLETGLGKTINFGLDIGLRALLPDVIENEVISIKDTIINNGFKEGINKVISSVIDFGKSAIGIVTGKFENISQVQTAIKNGGIIDSVSNLLDKVLNKTANNGKLSYNIVNTIKKGKNVVLNSITNKIEEEFSNQLDAAEKLEKYSNNWKQYFNNKDFDGMQKEYEKMKEKFKILIPMENTLKQGRIIENLHMLIKNNGKNFDLTNEQIELANLLT